MSTEPQLNPSEPNALPQIETVYTTVESQPDQTDWLTVVSNLRQINRQLVEQIARLEQALASSKQTLHTYKEEKQTHEITILQQQDELRLAQDRVGALFQQLETSHQIGQRQQTLIETLSQQLEITQAIVPQLEAENNELRQKYQQQTQQLSKTEQVALELHRRMKHQAATPNLKATDPPAEDSDEVVGLEPLSTEPAETQTETEVEDTLAIEVATNPADVEATSSQPDLATPPTPADSVVTTAEISPANPQAIPAWSPSATRTITAATPGSWREAIDSNNTPSNYAFTSDSLPSSTPTPPPPSEVVNKESTVTATPRPSTNWPAPTLEWRADKDSNLDVPTKKTVIDLPKFPKKK